MENYYFFTQKMCVGYDKKPLIKDMEIALEKGEILSIIGPNGAGKSTVLKSIARQLQLLGGAVYLGENALADMKANALARKMAVVFTQKVKAEMKSCRDVIATGRYPYTGWFGALSKEDERIVDEVMEFTHTLDIGGQDFQKISDGQKQRVMLARALCQEPEIILLDEPTSYLDIRYKLEFLSLLQEMREKKGLTVIMSLHELELAKLVSDKILCLKGEYVERYGTPEEIFTSDFIERLYGIEEKRFAGNENLLAYIRKLTS
ncbi:MAG: ABC transporter ATP-binding protein [Muribaculaceae bacterium]|nr:ABC transporter ATP-binding protein [Muribaculaceae bacterium]